ncbi:MFS transporter [Limibacillus halophilus]
MNPEAAYDPTRRNVLLLAFCQALHMSCMSLLMTISAIVGAKVAPSEDLATLPLALQFLFMMVFSIPASLGMGRYGRRIGFSLGALGGLGGGLLAAFAVLWGDFLLLCLGTGFVGIASAHATYYRFAAADTAKPGERSRAISWVLAGGVLAAVLGPQLAKETRGLMGPESYAGAFFAIAVLQVLILAVLQFIQIPRPDRRRAAVGRSVAQLLAQPAFLTAVLCSMVSYGAMNLIMVATPLAMVQHHHGFDAAATVIQFHVLAMYLPSFFTGGLIQRIGLRPVLIGGVLMILGCVAVNFTGVAFLQFTGALVLLGMGWNFLFVGGSTLLVRNYEPEEQARAQAINDFSTFTTVTVTAFGSGALLKALGWQAVNLAVVPALLLVLLFILRATSAKQGIAAREA